MLLLLANPPNAPPDWVSHPILYNVAHPWHWLTYGNNGTAAATAAVLIYTYLTYQMARTSQEALKASYRPMLAIAKTDEPFTFKVQNIGTGPATGVRVKLVHYENPNGPKDGSWFRGISPVTPITSIQGIPLGREAWCTFTVPEHLRNIEFNVVSTCWDMTRTFQQSFSNIALEPQWENRELGSPIFSRSGFFMALISSMHPSDERRIVYCWYPGLQGLYLGAGYFFYFRKKFAEWKNRLGSSSV